MLNPVFVALIAASLLIAAFGGRMLALDEAVQSSAREAVQTVIRLVGFMALWLGLMRVLREAGAMAGLARALAPLMRRLFPDVPADHPAMSAMILNLAANVLGMGNAATPFGLKAMRELDTLNPRRGVATDAMALFLAINTAGVAILPLGAIAIRAQLGSQQAGAILLPSVLAALCSTAVAIALAKLLQRRRRYAFETQPEAAAAEDGPAEAIAQLAEAEALSAVRPARDPLRAAVLWAFALALIVAAGRSMLIAAEPETAARELAGSWLMPALMGWIVLFGWSRRVAVYDAVIRGSREGLEIAVAIAPFLIAILVAVGMLRASGGLDEAVRLLAPLTSPLGFPAEALPMALIRPLSGSAAVGVLTETLRTYGPDSFVGQLVSVINGSSETTFYVIALYFGSVRVRVIRHTLLACLGADIAGTAAALLWCRVFF